MFELARQVDEAAAAIRDQWKGAPRVGIILGTGLGSLAGEIEAEATLDYQQIPHFPQATAVSHAGLRELTFALAGDPWAILRSIPPREAP